MTDGDLTAPPGPHPGPSDGADVSQRLRLWVRRAEPEARGEESKRYGRLPIRFRFGFENTKIDANFFIADRFGYR